MGSAMANNSNTTVTKAEIVNEIYIKTQKNRAEVKQLVEELILLMKKGIKEDKELMISGFGKFSVYAKNARKGRNPQTDEPMILPSRNVLVFGLSKKFRDALNRKRAN